MKNNLDKSIHKGKINQKFLIIESFLFLLKIDFLNIVASMNSRNLNNYYSEIHLVIQGRGEQKLLYKDFITEPSEVYVNGIKRVSCKKKCDLDIDRNNITLRFENTIRTCHYMFFCLYNIIEVDLSDFDASKVTDMGAMFYSCSKIEKIKFGNIQTSSIENMHSLFFGCSKLKYLDLSNFDTSKVNSIYAMFQGCNSLIFLNLKSFKLMKSALKNKVFEEVSPNIKYCTEDINLKNYISKEYSIESSCDDICFKENIKIDIIYNNCRESCLIEEYEYNNVCFGNCPNNTYSLFCDGDKCKESKKECFDKEPEGYYLDINNKVY